MITTPEGSVSASGWFSWPKFCPTYLLRLFGILALLCLGTAFALSSLVLCHLRASLLAVARVPDFLSRSHNAYRAGIA